MTNCPACSAEVAPGTRWCGICHMNVVKPTIGRLASPGKRLGGHILDLAIPVAAVIAIFVVSAGTGAAAQAATGSDSGIGLGVFFGFALFIAYVVWALTLFAKGTTPGKNLLGMRVVREDGGSAGFGAMLIREWIGKWISSLIFGLGFLWILFDRENQGWHDKLMSTYVVQPD